MTDHATPTTPTTLEPQVGLQRRVIPPFVRHNLNAKMKYRILPRGREVRKAFYAAYGMEPPRLRPDGDGFIEDQVWVVFEMFGAALHIGGDPPIETEIWIQAESEAV